MDNTNNCSWPDAGWGLSDLRRKAEDGRHRPISWFGAMHPLPAAAGKTNGGPIVIDQRINKDGEAVASPQVFEMNYFRKP